MKSKISVIAIAALLLFSISICASADCPRSWYIRRNGQNAPNFSKDSSIVDKYNGYYIDKSASESQKKILYLTFDAGYENGNIERILDTLKKEAVPAAFFVLDNLILKNTDLVIRMTEEGHLVCNHTADHRDLTAGTREEIVKSVTNLEKLYDERIGGIMPKYFRFPEGKYDEESLRIICELGYKSIFWSFAYDDWDNGRQPSHERAMKKILSNTHDGAVILLHPTSKTNADILPALISEWRKMGYSFGTLDDLTK